MKSFQVDNSWTLFLDRDGVINERKIGGYIESIEEFTLLPNVIDGLQRLSKVFNHIFIVTNQQGIGKGLVSKKQVEEIHQYLLTLLKEKEIEIDAIFYADNLKGAINDRRKPLSMMAVEAKEKFPETIFEKSVMVGDTDSDLQFGRNLGMKVVLVKSIEKTYVLPDIIVNDLNELANELEIE